MKIVFLISLILFSLNTYADIQDKSHLLNIAITIDAVEYDLKLKPFDKSSPEIIYKLNMTALIGVQASYEWLYLFYKSSLKARDSDIFNKGNTSYDDLRGTLFFGDKSQYSISGYYNRYKGLYIENTDKLNPGYVGGSPLDQHPNLRVTGYGINVTHIFKPEKFSLAATFAQSAIQKVSGGSWLGHASLDHIVFSDSQPIVPGYVASSFGSDANLTEAKFDSITIAGGYGHSWIYNKIYATLLGQIGLGREFGNFTNSSSKTKKEDASTKAILGFGLGYNTDEKFFGIKALMESTGYLTNSSQINASLISTQLFFGTRY